MPRLTRGGFEALADEKGAILAYPDGLDKNWNDYRADKNRKAQRENIDDVAFLSLMLDEIAKNTRWIPQGFMPPAFQTER